MNTAELSIELVEYQAQRFDPSEAMDAAMEELWEHHSNHFEIQFPTRKTANQWEIKAGGVAGQVELSAGAIVWVRPKCSMESLLRMIFAAYRGDFAFDENYLKFDQQVGVIDLIASEFNQLVQLRLRKGLYKSYEKQEERLYDLRGRICFHKFLKRHWETRVDCEYHIITADNSFNQILLFAFDKILQSKGLLSSTIDVSRRVRRKMAQQVSSEFFNLAHLDLEKRNYNRVNDDYKLLHQLARYFIGNNYPGDVRGDSPSRSFLIETSSLFEDCMVALCRKGAPVGTSFAPHIKRIDRATGLEFRMDMVIFQNNRPAAVVDAKYKTSSLPSTSDLQQVVAYAESLNVKHAFLIYPTPSIHPVNLTVGDIHVKSLVFDISERLEDSSQILIEGLVEKIASYVEKQS